MKKSHLFFSFLAFALAFSTSSSAAIIHGYGLPSSDAALSSGAVIDFESESLGTFTSLTIGEVTFSTNGSDIGYIEDTHTPGYNSTGVQSLQNWPYRNSFETLTFDFSSTVGAFGFNFGASNEDWLLEAFDSSNNLLDSYLLPQTWWQDDGEFFGLEVDGIVSASLTQLTHEADTYADHILLDNFTYVASNISEPATLLLMATGLVGLGTVLRKQK